jgi:TolA-binding protein
MRSFPLIILITATFVSAAGLDVLPVKALNPAAAASDLLKTADRVMPVAFEKNKRFTVRKALPDIVKELQMRQAGLSSDAVSPALAAADWFVISGLWEKDGQILFQLRVMSAEDCRLVYARSFTCKKNAFERTLLKTVQTAAEELAEIKTGPQDSGPAGDGLRRVTVLRIDEDGSSGLAPAVAGLFLNGLLDTGRFTVVEREEARWAVQEREIEMMGFVDRSAAKEAAKIQSIDLGVEGYVVTRNTGIISFDIKVVDMVRGTLLFRMYDECYSEADVAAKIASISRTLAEKYYVKLSRLEIASTPAEADCTINGTHYGRTPLLVTDIESGTYEIGLKKEGYDAWKGTATLKSGRPARVEAKMIRLDKKFYQMGLDAEKKKDWTTAIAHFEAFIKAYPGIQEAADAKFRVAHIYQFELKDFPSAITAYEELIKSRSGLWILSESLYGLGSCLIECGKKNEGLACLKKIIEEYPETSAAEFSREKLQ